MSEEIRIDENLWFYHHGCEGKHFLVSNPHTSPGRMWAWCPIKKSGFCVSKAEILESSLQTEYWVKGFLIGNQPAPPTNENEDVDLNSEPYKLWNLKVEEYEQTGNWDEE